MMAGDVTVDFDLSGSDYDIKIDGDRDNNGVEVRQIGNELVIRGTDNDGPTSINGVEGGEYRLPMRLGTAPLNDINIDMGRGLDKLEIFDVDTDPNTNLAYLPGTDFADINVELGSRVDEVMMQNVEIHGDLNLSVGSGSAVTLDLDDVSTGGHMDIQGGGYGDVMKFRQLDVGGDLTVDTFGGNDHIDISFSRIRGDIEMDTGVYDDKVSLDVVAFDDFFLDLGRGNDSASVRRVLNADTIDIDAGSGDDVMSVQSTRCNELELIGNRGDDEFLVRNSIIGDLDLYGGRGDDTVQVDRVQVRSLYLSGGLGSDELQTRGQERYPLLGLVKGFES